MQPSGTKCESQRKAQAGHPRQDGKSRWCGGLGWDGIPAGRSLPLAHMDRLEYEPPMGRESAWNGEEGAGKERSEGAREERRSEGGGGARSAWLWGEGEGGMNLCFTCNPKWSRAIWRGSFWISTLRHEKCRDINLAVGRSYP